MSATNNTNISAAVVTSTELCIRAPFYQNTIIILFIITSVLSVVENVIMWIAFSIEKKLRTIANSFVISLSLSDFATTATLAWMEIYYVWHYPHWSFGELGTLIQNSMWCLSLVTPFVHVIVITMDRYFAVTATTNYLRSRSWFIERIKICAIWLYSGGVVLLMAFYFTPAPRNYFP